MTEVYFHCSDAEHMFIDRRGAAMNLAEAREHAEQIIRSMVMTPSAEDWREWALHVTDEIGAEIFVLPFTTVLGQLH
jgi:uncharacterized protein DUF6894